MTKIKSSKKATIWGLAAVMALALNAVSAYAAPITTFGGVSSPVTDAGGVIPFAGITTMKLGTLTINGLGMPFTPLAGANQLVDATLTVSTFATPGAVNASPASFAFTVPNNGFVTPFGTMSGGVVTFQVINPLETVGIGTTTTFGSLTDGSPEFKLLSNTSNLDFGPLNTLFHLQLSTQGITYSGGANGTFTSTGIPTGSFTAIITAVPEPSTLFIFGFLAIGSGVVYVRRRLRNDPISA